jgi:hypothetical protein
MHSSHRTSSSSSNSIATPSSFFQSLHPDLMGQTLLYLSDLDDLRKVNRSLRKEIDYAPHWRQRLQSDFGLSLDYCKLITKDKKNPGAALRIIYQRLAHLKAEHLHTYRECYENNIIKHSIDFPPLLATGPVYPVVDEAKRVGYLAEAMRLRNLRFAESLFLQMISEASGEVSVVIFEQMIEVAAELHNMTLLERMLSCEIDPAHVERIEFALSCIRRLSSDQMATDLFHPAIKNGQYVLATHMLLQKKVNLTKTTLAFVVSKREYNNYDHKNLILELARMAQAEPALLNFPNSSVFNSFVDVLREKADITLLETIYQSLDSSPEYQEILRTCLLECIVMSGDLSRIKSYEQDKKLTEKEWYQLTRFAIKHGQLSILKHVIHTQDKSTLINDASVRYNIKSCHYKKIVKYLVEEFKLFESLDHEEKSEASHVSQNNGKPLSVLAASFGWYNWLEAATQWGRPEVVKYLVHEAPIMFRLTATEATLGDAIIFNQVASARYLVESCGIKPTRDHVRRAASQGYHELVVYLLSQCLDISTDDLSSKQLLLYMRRLNQPNDAVNKALDWLTGPEGVKRGFQFNLEALIEGLSARYDNLSMVSWLATKLNIPISLHALDRIRVRLADDITRFHMHYWGRTQVSQLWEAIFSDILISLGHTALRPVCETNHDRLSSSEAKTDDNTSSTESISLVRYRR